jgi:tetratricopeptide (TPR) repeat protein
LQVNPWSGYSRHAELSVFYEADFAEGLAYSLQAYAVEPTDIFSNNAIVLVFSWIGEYEEARRISDVLDSTVDIVEGQFEDAVATTQRKLMFDPENSAIILNAADALYEVGRLDEARLLYERLREFVPPGRPISKSIFTTMRLASTLRRTGDEDGARATRRIAELDHEMRLEAGYTGQNAASDEATIAAFGHDSDAVMTSIDKALQLGLRDPTFLRDSMFDEFRDDRRFIELRERLDSMLAEQHMKVLQLICFNNPVPQAWRPLPETCAGVSKNVSSTDRSDKA